MATDELRALPVQTFAASQIEQAFRTMQLAKHTGKLVLTLENSTLQCNATSSYLIVGGLGDLGLATCQFLINHGAKYVTLLGRSEIRPHKLDLIDGFKKQGVTVRIISADLNNPEELQEVLQVTNTEQNPLRGIIHCAGVLDDGMMSQLTPDRFLKVFQPKIDLTWQLHLKTLAMPLDFFILYSSAASLLGSPGQSNYVIANTFLDRFACYRRSLGLKATVVNWGAWSDIGFAARLDLKEKLLLQGVEMLSTVEAFDALAQLLPLDTPQIGVMRIDWKRYLANNLHRSFYKNLTQFSDASESQETESFSTLFIQTPLPERSYLMNNFLSDTLKSVLRFNENHQFDQKQGFLDLGMDSLTSVEFKNRLSSSLNLSLAATIVFDYPNILTLSDYLLNRLNQHPTSQTIQSSSMLSNEMENILGLSEDEAEESLRITLNEMGFEIK
jgi:NAD(P)-dependent dehydrogenase (short-subunit alcohol dehydrogenase family)